MVAMAIGEWRSVLISHVVLKGFRCFGPTPTTVELDAGLTVFIGDNGSGKTALMLSLLRVLGAGRQSIVRQDFHVPPDEVDAPDKRTLSVELKLVFPELMDEGSDTVAVPEFFNQMTVDGDGDRAPVCRLRLEATWVDDGTHDGVIDQQHYVVLPPEPASSDVERLLRFGAEDRAHLRMVYVPAVRDGTSHMADFLRGRLWRAMRWSDDLRETLAMTGATLNNAFLAEPGVARVSAQTAERWSGLYGGGTDSTPVLAPIDVRLGEFVRGVQMKFRPDELGGDRPLSELSDGQRSLFHISMTAAALDIESGVTDMDDAWDTDKLIKPFLTVVAVEEPENNLSPFYLSRIIRQLQDIAGQPGVQAIISSHSPSILARIDPSQVRHFRVDSGRKAQVRSIELPADPDDAAKYVREAVRTYPELYFASFVILGEGSSEEVVIPRIAEATGVEIDRSFVAVVPLGGRHVNHLWRLLSGLGIPYATLLDLDRGRDGGGWGRVQNACRQLLAIGITAKDLFGDDAAEHDAQVLVAGLGAEPSGSGDDLRAWLDGLRRLASTSVSRSTSTWRCCVLCGSTTLISQPVGWAHSVVVTQLRRFSAAKAIPIHTSARTGPRTSFGTATCSSDGASRTPTFMRSPA
ncbi:AAA domain-containing protein, putative AbiEii toxin, Type IV TA system [Asanoa ishikariensis]|uniref:AAA domain-containing protein, putative AbiEii toxin, Type IV TA system n=2 Tax=Asanoa ishikariensis TaxID=137265 RepID=A0A1H3U996_9ACTN|nr:AAA domain-containing protein, putative AbiEii toxin, Type IV TA system [Asanoa ishikariensis]